MAKWKVSVAYTILRTYEVEADDEYSANEKALDISQTAEVYLLDSENPDSQAEIDGIRVHSCRQTEELRD